MRFGFSDDFNIYGSDFHFNSKGSSFDLHKSGKLVSRVEISLIGRHNIMNSLGALTCAIAMGVPEKAVVEALRSFNGVKRRLELVYDEGGIMVYDDFAHHPTAYQVTLEGLKSSYPDRRIIGVIEPRTNTMTTGIFQDRLPASLKDGDVIIISGIHRSERLSNDLRLNPFKVCEELKKAGKESYYIENPKKITDFLKDFVEQEDVLVFMSNGDFGAVVEEFTNRLKSNYY